MNPLRQQTAGELEVGLIAACWADPDNARILLGTATADDFHTASANLQFRVLQDCWRKYRSVDPPSLKKISADRGWPDSYTSVRNAWASGSWAGYGPGHLKSLLDQVRDESSRVRFLKAVDDGKQMLADPHRSFAEAQTEFIASLSAAASTSKRHSAEHWSDGLGALAETIRERQAAEEAGKVVVNQMSTGIPELDDVLGGIEESDLVVIAARPRVGKTAKGLQLASSLAANYGTVLFLSLELSRRKMWLRLAAQQLQLPIGAVNKLPEKVEEVRRLNTDLWIDDQALRPDQLLQRVELFRLEHPNLKAVFIDHLGIMAGDGADYKLTSMASNVCRRAMKATGIPFVVLVQIGRKADDRSGGRPTLGDLKMSGCIEEDARKVVLLHRPPLYKPKGSCDPFEAVAIVAKNGEGSEGDVPMHFNGPTFTFRASQTKQNTEKLPGKDFPVNCPPEFEDHDWGELF